MPRIDAVWWDLELRTKGMDGAITRAESNLKRLASTILKHPVAAIGALGGALIAAAGQAAMFADKIQQSMTRVGNLIPTARGHLKAMERDLVSLSKEVPFSIGELAEGLERVGKQGARGPAEALKQLRVSAQAALATGESLGTTIDALDTIMDAFGISAQGSSKAMDLLVAATQRGLPFADLAQILEKAGASARQAGVGLDQVVAAAISMREAGVPVRQIVSAFTGGLGELRREGDAADGTLGRLASTITFAHGQLKLAGAGAADYAGNLQAVNTQGEITVELARRMGLTAEAQAQIVKNKLSAEWLNFGNTVLPLVTWGFRQLNKVLDLVTGTAGDKRLTAAARTVLELAPGLRAIRDVGARPDAESLKRFNAAWIQMARGLKDGHLLLGLAREDVAALIDEITKADPNTLRAAFAGQLGALKDVEDTRRRILEALREAAGIALPAEGGAPPAAGGGISPELAKRQADFLTQMRASLAGLTSTLVDDLTLAFDQVEAKAREIFGDQLPAAVRDGLARLRQQLETERFLEPFAKEIDGIEAKVTQIGDAFGAIPLTLGAEILPDLERIQGALVGQLALVEDGSAEQQKIQQQLERIEALWKKIVAHIGKADDETSDLRSEHEQLLSDLREQATTIERAARGALQLAQAFGLVDEQTAAALENIAQIAASIPGALAGDPSSILSVLGGLSGVISGLFGESPEDKRRKEVLQQNTDAIEKLSKVMGEFGLNITGRQLSGVLQALQGVQPHHVLNSLPELISPTELEAALRRAGVTMADLKQIAEQLGITFDFTAKTWRQLMDAIQQTELTQFAQTFEGQLEALASQFQLFDVTDPIEQLKLLAQVAKGFAGSPLVDQILGGIDLSTPEGRAELERRIQDTFNRITGGTITPGELGGLTPSQLLDLLTRLEGTMDQLVTGGDTGTSQQFQVERTITEVTGNRLASLLLTGTLWQEQTAKNTALMAAILSGTPVGMLQPPTAEQLAAWAGGGGSVSIGQVIVQVQPPPGMSPTEARQVGAALGDGFITSVNDQLGVIARRRALLQGSVVRN